MNRILGPDDIEQGIAALAAAIRERTAGKPIALVGIRSRGAASRWSPCSAIC